MSWRPFFPASGDLRLPRKCCCRRSTRCVPSATVVAGMRADVEMGSQKSLAHAVALTRSPIRFTHDADRSCRACRHTAPRGGGSVLISLLRFCEDFVVEALQQRNEVLACTQWIERVEAVRPTHSRRRVSSSIALSAALLHLRSRRPPHRV